MKLSITRLKNDRLGERLLPLQTCGCSERDSLEDKILVPLPRLVSTDPLKLIISWSQLWDPNHGFHCQRCALNTKRTFEESLHRLPKTLPSHPTTIQVVNAAREPIIVNQDPGGETFPQQVLPHIDIVVTSAVIPFRRESFLSTRHLSILEVPFCYDDDEDNTIAITPVLPIEEPDNSLSMGDKHLDTIPETESDEVIKSSVEDLVPIPSESEDDYPYVKKLLNVNLLIAKIDSLRDNPTPSSEVVIKSTSTFPNLFLEEANTFDNSIPESELLLNIEEISSGVPLLILIYFLPDYKAFLR
ncbi:hypothetical protein Tco_1556698 [Tanacetum coccineum]